MHYYHLMMPSIVLHQPINLWKLIIEIMISLECTASFEHYDRTYWFKKIGRLKFFLCYDWIVAPFFFSSVIRTFIQLSLWNYFCAVIHNTIFNAIGSICYSLFQRIKGIEFSINAHETGNHYKYQIFYLKKIKLFYHSREFSTNLHQNHLLILFNIQSNC